MFAFLHSQMRPFGEAPIPACVVPLAMSTSPIPPSTLRSRFKQIAVRRSPTNRPSVTAARPLPPQSPPKCPHSCSAESPNRARVTVATISYRSNQATQTKKTAKEKEEEQGSGRLNLPPTLSFSQPRATSPAFLALTRELTIRPSPPRQPASVARPARR